ncbi:MAG: VWA domain-containing protein [Acidobacteria bacterium]|nr:VWA domain-containing protein [Acidobacteriota bacterium]
MISIKGCGLKRVMNGRLALWIGIALALNVLSQGWAQESGQPQKPFEIAVDVNLVLLHATVSDRKGNPVVDLASQAFEVYEEGTRQTIRLFRREDVPVTVGLVVDHSGSMRRKLNDVIGAARTFVRLSNREDEMFVINFNERVTLGLADPTAFTNDSGELESAILQAPTTGQTALYDAVIAGLKRLAVGHRAKKVLIVISDGGDNASTRGLSDVLQLAGQSNALIYTIGTFDDQDPDRNPDVLRRLSRATGGQAFFPRRLSEVVPICEHIARDIRTQYTIGYTPASGANPGTYRSVRVAARRAGRGRLVVRTRAGYIAAGDSEPTQREDAR